MCDCNCKDCNCGGKSDTYGENCNFCESMREKYVEQLPDDTQKTLERPERPDLPDDSCWEMRSYLYGEYPYGGFYDASNI